MTRCWKMIGALLVCFLFGILSCRKTASAPISPITPLQALVNTDTNLTLFHRMVLESNENKLLADDSVTWLIPTNAALRQAGYSESIIDSTSSVFLGRMVEYQYVTTMITPDSGVYTPYPTLLGSPIYILLNSGGQLLINGNVTASDTAMKVGKASVYFLNAALAAAADSLPVLLQSDTSLSFISEVYLRTKLYDSILLATGGSYTVLTPVNNAFRLLGYDSTSAIDSANIDSMIQLAQSQVIKGMYFTNTFPLLTPLPNLSGGSVTVSTIGTILQFTGTANTTPVNWLSGNQVAGSSIVMHKTDGFISP